MSVTCRSTVPAKCTRRPGPRPGACPLPTRRGYCHSRRHSLPQMSLAAPAALMLPLLLLGVLARPPAVASATASPFTVSARQFSGGDEGAPDLTMQVLANSATGESAEILQSWGGKVERVRVCKRAASGSGGASGGGDACASPPRDVIASRCDSGGADGTGGNCTAALLQGSSSLGALLIPFANRIAYGTYTFDGVEQRLSSDNSTVSHGFLIQGRPMELLAKETTATHAALTLGVVFNGSDPGYPYKVAVNVTYLLSDTGGLHVTVRARNVNGDGSACPFMAGCHPYFRLLHGGFETAKLVLDRCGAASGGGWNRQAQALIQVPSGPARRFLGFNGTDTLADPHEGCPACIHADGSIIWDDGFTNLATVGDCPSLTMRVLDGEEDVLTLELKDGFRYVQVREEEEEVCVLWLNFSVCEKR
jgi:hypothetical protein